MRPICMAVSTLIALSLASAAFAQETLKGEVATIDEASGKIGIRMTGTVGSSDVTAPTSFKVADGLVFNAAERVGDEMIIKDLKKD